MIKKQMVFECLRWLFPWYCGADCPLCSLPGLRSLFPQLSTLLFLALRRWESPAAMPWIPASSPPHILSLVAPDWLHSLPLTNKLYLLCSKPVFPVCRVALWIQSTLFVCWVFFLQLQTVCLRVCVRPSDTTEFHTPFEYRGVVNQAAAPLAACSIRILRPNADKRLHVEPQANWQRRRQRTAFEASAASLRLWTGLWQPGQRPVVVTVQWQFRMPKVQILWSLSLCDSTAPAAALCSSRSYLFFCVLGLFIV